MPQFLATGGAMMPKSEALFRDRYSTDDSLRSSLDNLSVGTWVTAPIDHGRASLGGSFNLRWLAVRGISHAMGSRLLDSAECSADLWIFRSGNSVPFGAKDMAALEAITPHLACAAELAVRIRRLSLMSRVMLAASRQQRPAYIVTDVAGRIFEANGAAREILEQGDALFAENGCLAARRRFETTALHRAIASISPAARSQGSASYRTILVGRTSDRPAYFVTVAKFGASKLFSARADIPLALVLITDPEHFARVEAHDLRGLFALTPAEQRLMHALVHGKRLQEIAVEIGVKIATVRTQLASILRKLDVKRQSDVVRIALSIPTLDTDALSGSGQDKDIRD